MDKFRHGNKLMCIIEFRRTYFEATQDDNNFIVFDKTQKGAKHAVFTYMIFRDS